MSSPLNLTDSKIYSKDLEIEEGDREAEATSEPESDLLEQPSLKFEPKSPTNALAPSWGKIE